MTISKKFVIISAITVLVLVLISAPVLTYRYTPFFIDAGDSYKGNSNAANRGFIAESDSNIAISVMPLEYSYDGSSVLPEQGILLTDIYGNNIELLTRNYGTSLSFSDTHVYYSNKMDNGYLYRVSLDGTTDELVAKKEVITQLVHDGYSYFNSTDKVIYRLNLDTLELESIAENAVLGLSISGDRIYYIEANSGLSICSVPLKGGTVRRSVKVENAHDLIVFNGYQYYLEDATLFRVKIGSVVKQKVMDTPVLKYAFLDDNTISYIDAQTCETHTCDLNGGNISDSLEFSVYCRQIGTAHGETYALALDSVYKSTITGGHVQYSRYSSTNPTNPVISN